MSERGGYGGYAELSVLLEGSQIFVIKVMILSYCIALCVNRPGKETSFCLEPKRGTKEGTYVLPVHL
jgi:hypothetical protein